MRNPCLNEENAWPITVTNIGIESYDFFIFFFIYCDIGHSLVATWRLQDRKRMLKRFKYGIKYDRTIFEDLKVYLLFNRLFK